MMDEDPATVTSAGVSGVGGNDRRPSKGFKTDRAPSILDGLIVVGLFEIATRLGPSTERHWVVIAVLGAVGLLAGLYGRGRGYAGPGWNRLGGAAYLATLSAGVGIALVVWGAVGVSRLAIGWSHPYIPWWAASSITSTPLGRGILIVLVAPVVEELVFRGAFYRSLRTRFPVAVAVAVSAVVFTVGHPFGSLYTAVLLGIVTAIVYEKCRTLLAPIAVHAACNGGLLLFGLAAHHVAGVPGTAG